MPHLFILLVNCPFKSQAAGDLDLQAEAGVLTVHLSHIVAV